MANCLITHEFFNVDFWIRDSFHYEQPIVTHMNELVVIAYTESETFQAGTTKDLNELFSGSNGKAGIIDIKIEKAAAIAL